MQVLVCGAGVIGLACAHFARERGHEVTVVDREPRERDACSFGNTGLVVPSHFVPLAAPGVVGRALRWMFDSASPFYVRPRLDLELAAWALRFARAARAERSGRGAAVMRDLLLASRRLYEELARLTDNEIGLETRGLMVLARTRHGLAEEADAARRANALGIPAEVLTPERAAELDPGARMDIVGAVHYPLDCHLTPSRLMRTLLTLTEQAGVRFHWSTEITGWRVREGRVTAARASNLELPADAFVVAGGSWSSAAVRSLGIRLPLQPGKGYSLTLPQPPCRLGVPYVLSEANAAVTPMGDELRIGGTMELTGMNRTVRPERIANLVAAAGAYFPQLAAGHFRDVRPWVGLRPLSPDGLPYVGRSRRHANLCIATGHAMMGVSLAPVTGFLVAETLSGAPPSLPVEALDPNRYGG